MGGVAGRPAVHVGAAPFSIRRNEVPIAHEQDTVPGHDPAVEGVGTAGAEGVIHPGKGRLGAGDGHAAGRYDGLQSRFLAFRRKGAAGRMKQTAVRGRREKV